MRLFKVFTSFSLSRTFFFFKDSNLFLFIIMLLFFKSFTNKHIFINMLVTKLNTKILQPKKHNTLRFLQKNNIKTNSVYGGLLVFFLRKENVLSKSRFGRIRVSSRITFYIAIVINNLIIVFLFMSFYGFIYVFFFWFFIILFFILFLI